MTERERFDKILQRRPHAHHGLFARPHLSRRTFFRSTGVGLGGYFLGGKLQGGELVKQASAETKNTAKNVILIFLQGAPSQVDTFDFKMTEGVTPTDFQPEMVAGRLFPTGLMPKTAGVLDRVAVIRSGLSWALAHPLAQTWFQIGRNPTSATGRIAPHIGSIVALEKEAERRPDQIFPAFLSLNPAGAPGAGYLAQQYGPLKTQPSRDGLAHTGHAAGRERFERRWELLQQMDGGLRGAESPLGEPATTLGELYQGARALMFNPVVEQAFAYSEEDSVRYGGTAFGDACLVAKQTIEADQGTRFIQITSNGWDHHQGIYERGEDRNIYRQAGELDAGYATLLADLEQSGLLDETLVVMAGEFGRTVGELSNGQGGRDHYLQMFYALAGGGVTGGKLIGETNKTGAFTTETGWDKQRDVRPEDIEATIYSALGIDWTTVRYDDPLGRGFHYTPVSDEEVYAPVNALWDA